MEITIQILIGILGGIATSAILRFFTSVYDFVRRPLNEISIGTSFDHFYGRGVGDNYDDALTISIRNCGGSPLYIVRCVYFPDRKGKVPIYENARKSQKYPKGYEVKFGIQWKDLSVIIKPNAEVKSYIPMLQKGSQAKLDQGKRGKLLLEYVYAGSTGIHRTKL